MDKIENQDKKKLYLIDGSGFIFRAYHGLPPMNRPDGTPVNAVYGFTNMLLKLVQDVNAAYVAVLFDTSRISFRHSIYDLYKANRDAPPEDLKPQFALTRDAVRALNIHMLEKAGFEADDLIATYARLAQEEGFEVIIVSSDKDLMQLVKPGITMFDPMKNRKIGREEVIEKFGVPPEKLIDVQALAGDSVDNVPGVPGIGVKTAAQLINEYGDLEALLQKAEEIKQPKRRENLINHADDALMSKKLVTLDQHVDHPLDFETLTLQPPKPEALQAFLNENGFHSLKKKISQWLDFPDEEEPLEDTSKIDYEIIQDSAALKKWVTLIESQGKVAIDTETTSLQAMEAELVGISLAIAPGRACYIPLSHKNPKDLEEKQFDLLSPSAEDSPASTPVRQIPFEEALSILRPVLSSPAILKIGQNIKYDMLVLKKYDLTISPIEDTMLLSFALSAGQNGHGMDELSKKHLGITPVPYKSLTGTGKKQITFDYVELETAAHYAAEDADLTLRLYELLKPQLHKAGVQSLYERIERPLVPVLVDMEEAGVCIDVQKLQELSLLFSSKIRALETEIYALAGEEFLISSPKQVGEILFDKLSLKGGKKTKTGAYSTDASVLEELAEKGEPLPKKLLEYRHLSKLTSTYTEALQQQVFKETRRVHTSFMMTGAQTGRLSSSTPNVQNIPIRSEEGRQIREAFVVPPNKKMLSIDYSQIELRLIAEVAKEKSLQQAFHDGVDIHALTASQIFSIPLEGMDPMMRRRAKEINFGIIYGISSFGLANNLNIDPGEAKRFIDLYFERFPGIQTYMEEIKEFAKTHGYVETLFGRKIYLPGITDKNYNRRSSAERQAINSPIQGTAADLIKRAMIRIHKELETKNWKSKMLLQVHDELIFECPDEEIEPLIPILKEIMEKAAEPKLKLSVPIVAESGVGLNWAKAH